MPTTISPNAIYGLAGAKVEIQPDGSVHLVAAGGQPVQVQDSNSVFNSPLVMSGVVGGASAAGQGQIWFDSVTGKWLYSESGSAPAQAFGASPVTSVAGRVGAVTLTHADITDWTAQVNSLVNAGINNLVNGAPSALDTLKEFADAINDDANFSATVTTALANRLRIDTNAQGLTGTQQTNARTNLGLGALATLNSLASTDVGLGNVTNDAQTKAAIVPNTIPTAGQILVGSGTAYAPQSLSGDATLSSAGVLTVTKTGGVAFGALATLNSITSASVSDFNPAVNALIANVVNGAPAALDTLKELADALNDDANFASTVTTALAGKFPLAGGTLTGTAGAGFVGLLAQSVSPATPASGFALFADSAGKLSYKRTDGFVRKFDFGTPSADRTITFIDSDVTVFGATGAVTANRLGRITGAGVIGNSLLSDDGTDVKYVGSSLFKVGVGAKLSVMGLDTAANNYTRGSLSASTTAVTLAAESAGTGSTNLDIVLTPKGTGTVQSATRFGFTTAGFGSIVGTSNGIIVRQDATSANTGSINAAAVNSSSGSAGFVYSTTASLDNNLNLGSARSVIWKSTDAYNATADTGLSRSAAGVVKVTNGGAGLGSLRCADLGVNNSAAATTLGSVVKKIQIFDVAGTSLGYIPVYDAIT
jgi:hypothetical protein